MTLTIEEFKAQQPDLYAEYAEVLEGVTHNIVVTKDSLRWEADKLLLKIYNLDCLNLNKLREAVAYENMSKSDFLEFDRKLGSSLSFYSDVYHSINMSKSDFL